MSFALFWVLAWTRFDTFALFQAHTFFPLWLSLILSVNALIFKQKKTCLLSHSKFFLLFPVSALFWWVFEYLNRYVENWYYTGSEYPAVTYVFLATLSFSTVLPAVESVKTYLLTFDVFNKGFQTTWALPNLNTRKTAVSMLILSCVILMFMGVYPDILFAFVMMFLHRG